MPLLSRVKQLKERNLEIFRAYTKEKYSYRELKKRYGLSHARIGQIINGIKAARKGAKEAEIRGKLDKNLT